MLTNADIKEIRRLQEKSKARREAGLFIIEGEKLFMEAPLEWIERIYVTREYLNTHKSSDKTHNPAELIGWMEHEFISGEQMKRISDTQTPQGILCTMRTPEYSMDDILRKGGLILILEDIQDPGNLGTILRTAEGADASGVIMTRGCVDIYNPKVVRSTMGSLFRVPFIYTDSLQDEVRLLKEKGYTIYAARPDADRYYYEENHRASVFMIGNEGNGLSEAAASYADTLIRIPMEGRLESLNASVAASILMYHHYTGHLRGLY